MFCGKEGGAGRGDVVNEDNRAPADTRVIGTHKRVVEIGKSRTAFLGACLRFCLADAREDFGREFKDSAPSVF